MNSSHRCFSHVINIMSRGKAGSRQGRESWGPLPRRCPSLPASPGENDPACPIQPGKLDVDTDTAIYLPD